MSGRSLGARLIGRIARERAARAHAAEDRRLATRTLARVVALEREITDLMRRITEEPERPWILPDAPAARVGAWQAAEPGWSGRACAEAAPLLDGSIPFFGRVLSGHDPGAWTRDPATGRRWPLRSHATIRLDDPQRPGDVRIQWEVARFHHAILLGRSALASGDPAPGEVFQQQILSFARGNPFFQSVHWAVGMEVGIRASACLVALEMLRGARALPAGDARILQILFAHGCFLEAHIERNPLGFTTNHTLSDHAGLAMLGRAFAGIEEGRRWSALAAAGLAECLREQVLAGGAHAEASLAYERYVLEAALVGAVALGPPAHAPLLEPLRAMARHLRDARLPSGLPMIGDGDDSFFPPFLCTLLVDADPRDPEPALQAAAHLLGEPDLRSEERTREAAFWLGAPPTAPAPRPARLPVRRLTGLVRFGHGAFEGALIVRDAKEGWLPTHGHNDLLSIVLDVDGRPVLIDPGTGGYACERELRVALRATSAHSTLQLEDREQSPLRPRAIFEGPRGIDCKVLELGEEPFELVARHGGFGSGWIHERRLRAYRRGIGVFDSLSGPAGAPPTVSTVRFRLAPGLAPELMPKLPPPLTPEPTPRTGRSRCRVPLPGGMLELLLLRPRGARWRIRSVPASRRYAAHELAPLLEGTYEGPLPHAWRVALTFRGPA